MTAGRAIAAAGEPGHSALALLALGLALCLSTPAVAQTRHDTRTERVLLVDNHGPMPIRKLYVSAANTNSWGAEQLAGTAIAPGDSVRVQLGRGTNCRFDVEVIYADGRGEDLLDIDVCKNPSLAFNGAGATLASDKAGAPHQLRLTNRSGRPIVLVFVSAASADAWGDDRLDVPAIPIGGSQDIAFQSDCNVDLRVVFDNRAAEERRGIDACIAQRLVIAPGWTTADTDDHAMTAQIPAPLLPAPGH